MTEEPGVSQQQRMFQNPVSLVLRMLRSGKRAAWSALFREALRYMAIPLDLLLLPFERRQPGESDGDQRPCILIVGPPRSGTTLVYQVLASCLNVSYISNLVALFPRSPIMANRIFGRWTQRAKVDFSNYYGQTSRLSGPNDGFSVWNRWLGEDRYQPQVDDTRIADMQRFFQTWSRLFSNPFINKNNRNTACINDLARSLPTAVFVVVRRDPITVVRSLIRAREHVQGDKRLRWGLSSQEIESYEAELGYVDDVCQQVTQIERDLSSQLTTIEAHRFLEVTYEQFCVDPVLVLDEIVAKVSGLTLTPDARTSCPVNFSLSPSIPLSDDEESRIREALAAWPKPSRATVDG